jgi:hypothetical protein
MTTDAEALIRIAQADGRLKKWDGRSVDVTVTPPTSLPGGPLHRHGSFHYHETESAIEGGHAIYEIDDGADSYAISTSYVSDAVVGSHEIVRLTLTDGAVATIALTGGQDA